jgi:hypothetical protein
MPLNTLFLNTLSLWGRPTFEILHRVALERADVSEKRFHYQGNMNRWTRNNVSVIAIGERREEIICENGYSIYWSIRLPVIANVVPASLILVTFMMEALCSSETSVLTRTTRRKIPEDGIPITLQLFYRVSNHGLSGLWHRTCASTLALFLLNQTVMNTVLPKCLNCETF